MLYSRDGTLLHTVWEGVVGWVGKESKHFYVGGALNYESSRDMVCVVIRDNFWYVNHLSPFVV